MGKRKFNKREKSLRVTVPAITNLRYRLIRSHRLEWYQLILRPAPRIG